MPEKILIIDDSKEFREEFKEFLHEYEVLEAANGHEALGLLKKANDIDLVLLDVKMPGLSGIDILNEIKSTDPDLGIIILTGYSSKDVAIEALKGHADDFIEKSEDPERIRKAIEEVLEKKHPEGHADIAGIQGKIERVKRFVERNCFKKSRLADAAQIVCLSTKYLSRIFKEQTGESYVAYRLRTKIKAAQKLLRKGEGNVSQISYKLGYENPESFIRQFKKLVKCTPSEYRKKAKGTPKAAKRRVSLKA